MDARLCQNQLDPGSRVLYCISDESSIFQLSAVTPNTFLELQMSLVLYANRSLPRSAT